MGPLLQKKCVIYIYKLSVTNSLPFEHTKNCPLADIFRDLWCIQLRLWLEEGCRKLVLACWRSIPRERPPCFPHKLTHSNRRKGVIKQLICGLCCWVLLLLLVGWLSFVCYFCFLLLLLFVIVVVVVLGGLCFGFWLFVCLFLFYTQSTRTLVLERKTGG